MKITKNPARWLGTTAALLVVSSLVSFGVVIAPAPERGGPTLRVA